MLRDRPLIFDQLWTAPGDRPWIVDHGAGGMRIDDGRVAPREIAEAAGRAATLFEAQGTQAGDRCVVWLDRPLDIIVTAAGLTGIGAVPILVSPALDIDVVTRMLEPIPPVARVITTGSRAPSCSALEVRGRIDGWESLAEEARGLEPRRAAVRLPPTAPYVVTHTSGTTGLNKLIEYSRGGADHNSLTQEAPALLQRMRGYAAINFSPVHFRFVVGLLAALRRRVPLILLADDDPRSVGPILERWRPSYLETHPNTFVKWEPLAAAGSLESVKCFLATFDVMHPGTIKRLLAGSRYPYAHFWEIYGQSEVCAIAGRLHLKGFVGRLSERDTERRLSGHLVGRVLPGHSRVRIVDEQGWVVAPGTPGRIQVRATGHFTTYPNRPEAARSNRTPDDWWDTGDWGRKDRLGRVVLIDRQVERLTAAPSAIALEDVLLDRMPWLLEAVVLERDGALTPVIATRDGAFDTGRWQAATRDLPAFAEPLVLDETEIPRTATGKVQRAVLEALLAERGEAAQAAPAAAVEEFAR